MTAGSGALITAAAADDASQATGPVHPTGTQLLAAFPPSPPASSWPATQASRSAVVARVLAAPFALDNPASQQTPDLGERQQRSAVLDQAVGKLVTCRSGSRDDHEQAPGGVPHAVGGGKHTALPRHVHRARRPTAGTRAIR